MSKETPKWNDESFKKIWGGGGKTAKMKIRQQCSNWGYQDVQIHDKKNWVFQGVCNTPVDPNWSRPYSDESAIEEGYSNRNTAAETDCKKKGHLTIKPHKYIDKGDWYFQIQCEPFPVAPPGTIYSPLWRDEDHGSKWGGGGFNC
jgi:hypothetical protein